PARKPGSRREQGAAAPEAAPRVRKTASDPHAGSVQLNIYRRPSCSRKTSLTPAVFSKVLLISSPLMARRRYCIAPSPSADGLVSGVLLTIRCPTPQLLLSRLVKLSTSRRTCIRLSLLPRRAPSSCDTLRSARQTIGRKTALRAAYSPRCWLR